MAVALRDQAYGGSPNATNISVARPAATQVGDLLVAIVTTRTTSATEPAIQSGWSSIVSIRRSTSGWFQAFYRFAAVDDPATFTFTAGAATSAHLAVVHAFSGASGIDVGPATRSSAGTTSAQSAPARAVSADGTFE